MTIFNALIVEIHSRTRESFKSKVNPWHLHSKDRWRGRWNQEETDAEFVAMQGESEGKTRKERKKERESRMSFRGRLTSLSTRRLISLCPCLFVSLFRFPCPKIRKLFTYATLQNCTPHKWVGEWIQMSIPPPRYDQLPIFLFFSCKKKKTDL